MLRIFRFGKRLTLNSFLNEIVKVVPAFPYTLAFSPDSFEVISVVNNLIVSPDSFEVISAVNSFRSLQKNIFLTSQVQKLLESFF